MAAGENDDTIDLMTEVGVDDKISDAAVEPRSTTTSMAVANKSLHMVRKWSL